ncbi:MAG: 5-(carboxyamino)imidazole ribonucleotide synthase [Bacteroidetes bacterium]|nr:MAG: 5-(carboxyamino)imidazole ribonucleotide synthase [Bacteroidota bacterium]
MDSKIITSDFKLGIIAGGQLGKMLCAAASNWDVQTYVLDSDENGPAAKIANQFVKGQYNNFDDVYNFGKQVDFLTFEIEHVNIDALLKLQQEGIKIEPSPQILQIIQDKGLQKKFYAENNIPTSPFKLYQNKQEILEALSKNEIRLPFVQKSRKAGYDGKGVQVINSENDLNNLFDEPSVIEEKVDIYKELSVIVARNEKGQVKSFPVVEMTFNEQANLVEMLICPSTVPVDIAVKARTLAENLIEKMQMNGLLAVEMFLTKDYKILVNESAPRPHNSGHHTIESNFTSQYEQHLRAIFNFPLGSTEIISPAVMINLLGEPGHKGKVKYTGVEESLALGGVKMHVYGKKITRPFRKMGHVTVLASSVEKAILKAKKVQNTLKVIS